MAFQKYQGEQVQQIPAGYVEAMGSMGKAYQQVGASISAGLVEADKRQQEEEKIKGAIAPYIKNDDRTKAVEYGLASGVLTRADDGTVVASANFAGKIRTDYLDFYNSTGGDGSKLSGSSLNTFVSMYAGEQKYAAEQASRAAAKTEADLKKAQIDELKAKTAERLANAGMYAGVIGSMGFNTASVPSAGGDIGMPTSGSLNLSTVAAPTWSITEPTTSTTAAGSLSSVDDKPVGVAAPYTAPLEGETKPATTPAPAAPTPAPAAKAAAPAAMPPVKATAPAAKAPAQAPAPAAKATATAPAPAAKPAAAPTYDVKAETVRVNEQLKAIQTERDTTRAKYAKSRDAAQIQITRQKQATRLPSNKAGADLASTIESYNTNLLKRIDEAEARDLKALDDRESTVNREFANYQAAAAAGRAEKADAIREEAAARAAREEKTKETAVGLEADKALRTSVSEYPVKGPWVHLGYNMTDKAGNAVNPAKYGISPLNTAQQNEVSTTYDGWVKSTDFLVRLDNILQSRKTGDRDYTQRFRLLAGDMQNYFDAELASVFGVATFRRAIVSGGNFSDADREFVKSAITYLNTAAPDMSAEDLEASTRSLARFIDAMYRKGLESQGMVYNPGEMRKQIKSLRDDGFESQAAALEDSLAEGEKFYSRFGITPGRRTLTTPEEKAALLEARTTLWNALNKAGKTKGLEASDPSKFKPKK